MLHYFNNDFDSISLPQKFTFPFYYEVHPLAKIAAEALQKYLETQQDFEHNFGLNPNQKGLVIGKMFGVMVVKDTNENLGYLWAFSGKMAGVNHLQYFVPPVFDMLKHDGFFRKEEESINKLNREIEKLEKSEDFENLKAEILKQKEAAVQDLNWQKNRIKQLKIDRDERRSFVANLGAVEKEKLELELAEESKKENILLKKMTQYWKHILAKANDELSVFADKIEKLKNDRKQKSASLQQQLFDHYTFLNIQKKHKSIGQIFDNNPPAGAGECATPKLLQYAFLNELKPLCMAEFWWGQSPKSEIRKHGEFYPSCNSKCKPILLNHMLLGMAVDDNPLVENPAAAKDIGIVYDDEYLAVIYKPYDMLSVLGKTITDSVYTRVKNLFANATGPLVVHRLDMSTSGLMIIAKTEEIYTKIQSQFINRTIKKRYTALLNGLLKDTKGTINLPLRVDLDDRPRQLVCYEYGKMAVTNFEVISVHNNQSKIHFYPVTGRTHQLRVHAAHVDGLNAPIVGDDLYGTKAERLCLQASYISFFHPALQKQMEFTLADEF